MDQKALVDQLLGKDRNTLPAERVTRRWDDKNICPYYLVDYCPHNLFVNTKSDLGVCEFEHDDDMKVEFAKVDRRRQAPMELRFIRFLEKLIGECDRKVQKGKDRVKKVDGAEVNKDRIAEIALQIEETCNQIESLAEQGKVEESQKLVVVFDALIHEKKELEKPVGLQEYHKHTRQLIDKALQCCDVCGCITTVQDSENGSATLTERREKEHLTGKQHLGYSKLRGSLAALKQKHQEEKASHERDQPDRRQREQPREPADPRRGEPNRGAGPSTSTSRRRSESRSRRRGSTDRSESGSSTDRSRYRSSPQTLRSGHRSSTNRNRHSRSKSAHRAQARHRSRSRDNRK